MAELRNRCEAGMAVGRISAAGHLMKRERSHLPLLTQLLTEPKVQTKQFLVLMLWTTEVVQRAAIYPIFLSDIPQGLSGSAF